MHNLINIGDSVNWESQGIIQWSEPRIVVGINSGFALFEETSTGIPVEELIKQNKTKKLKISGKTLFLGDIHGNMRCIADLKSSGGAFNIIQVGDFGLFSVNHMWLAKLQMVLTKLNATLYAIRGNHDNPYIWTQSSEINAKYDRIHLLEDYTEIDMNGKSCLCLGGGISVDRAFRTEFKDYFPDEGVIYKDTDKKFDVLICHSAPSYFNLETPEGGWYWYRRDPALKNDLKRERATIDQISENIGCTHIIGGHFHNSVREDVQKHDRLIRYRGLNIDEFMDSQEFL